MKKKPLKITLLFSAAVILGLFIKFYFIGEPVDGAQLCCTVSVNGPSLELQVDSAESAMALRGWKWKQDGNALLISARKVPVSPLFSNGSFRASIDLEGIETISLGGTIIWTRETEKKKQ